MRLLYFIIAVITSPIALVILMIPFIDVDYAVWFFDKSFKKRKVSYTQYIRNLEQQLDIPVKDRIPIELLENKKT